MIMSTSSTTQRNARPAPIEAATHVFAVGQTVRLKGGYGIFASRFGDIYRVTATIPLRGDSLQYRIRNANEQHERVATEDSLEAVAAA